MNVSFEACSRSALGNVEAFISELRASFTFLKVYDRKTLVRRFECCQILVLFFAEVLLAFKSSVKKVKVSRYKPGKALGVP